MTVFKELVEYLLPSGVLEYFDIPEVRKQGNQLNIYLEEKDNIPMEHSTERYRSNGFLPAIKVQDCPIHDHLVVLHVKRRRWLLVDSGKKVKRDWTMVAPGTRITKDFAAFLKEIAR